MTSPYYVPGSTPYSTRLAWALLVGFLMSLLGAVAYNSLLMLSPFVYANFFVTVGFGYFIGLTVLLVSKLGVLRTVRQRFWMLAYIGVLSYYFQWVAFVNLYVNGLEQLVDIVSVYRMLFFPRGVAEIILRLITTGAWQIFGVTVKGGLLLAIWFTELALVVFIAWRFVRHQPLSPFSENKNAWYRKYTLKSKFESIPLIEEFVKRAEANPVAAVLALGPGIVQRHAIVTLYSLPDEPVSYLTIDNKFVATRTDHEETTPVLNLLKIDSTTVEELKKRFGSETSFWDRFI